MKLKGVNPLEEHLEKIVLIAVSAAFLIVLALQFLWEPNKVKVGAETVPPGKAFEKAEAKARQLKGRMEAAEPPQLEDARAQLAKMNTNPADDFKKRMLSPGTSTPPALASVVIGKRQEVEISGDDGPVGPRATDPIAAITIPAPGAVAAAPYRGTVDPTETISHPELKALLPAEQPMDKAWVSVEAHVDGPAVKQALSAVPEGGKARPLPRQWWFDTTALCSVKLERQEQTPQGQWSEPAEVKPPPGGFDIAALLKTASTTSDIEDLVSQARASEEAVLRPAFYHTIAGPEWTPPSTMAAAGGPEAGAPPQVETLVKQIKRDTDQRARVQKQRDEEEKKPVREPPRTPGPGGGGGGGKGGGGGGGGAAPQQPRSPEKDKQDALKKLDDQLKRIDDQIAQAKSKLSDLGYDETGKKKAAAAPANPGAAPGANANAAVAKSLFDSQEVQVWSHDLTVEPGKTYRYRVSVAIDNPTFGRANALVAEQKEMAASPLLWSQASEWSAPVTVPADRYYFITGTAEPNETGAAHATAEVYQFFYGYYRRGTATLEPGDIVSAQLHLPEGSRLPIFDLAAVPGDKQEGQPAPGQPVPPPPPSVTRDGDPRGKGGAQPGKLGQIPGGMPKGGPGQAPAAAQAKPVLPTNAKPWIKPITATVDAVLLDVAKPTNSSESAKADALLRVADGTIEARDPDEDRTNEMYKKVAASAKDGDAQPVPGSEAPKAAEPGPAPLGPKPPPKAPKPPPPPSSGGGGAGGG